MAVVETVARARVVGGAAVERLVCHPRLPLVAGLDSERPAVHIWDFGAREFRALAAVGAGSAVYGDALGSDRFDRTPVVAWHPSEPLLLVAGEDGVTRWAPAGVSELDELPPMEYLSLVLLLAVRGTVTGADDDTAEAAVREFLDSTDELPVGADLWTHLVITDGSQTWEPADRATVTTADPTDPSWLRIQAAMNSARAE